MLACEVHTAYLQCLKANFFAKSISNKFVDYIFLRCNLQKEGEKKKKKKNTKYKFTKTTDYVFSKSGKFGECGGGGSPKERPSFSNRALFMTEGRGRGYNITEVD